MEDFIGKYDGNQIDSRLDKVKDMVGATASEAGAAGLVPAPAAGKQASFLRGDGTWQDISVHEPGFLGDNFDDENDFRSILFNLAFGGISSLTQSQYNIIASKCEVDTTTQYLLSGSSSTYGIGDVILMRSSSGDIQVVLRTGGNGDSGYICYNVVIIISNDLTYTSSVSQYAMRQVNNSTKDIALAISNQSGDNRIINFSTAGSGTKALMDDGTYKEVQARSDVEDAAMAVLTQLLNNIDQDVYTCTQEQYNTLKALFKDVTKNTGILLKPSSGLVEYMAGAIPSDVLFIYDYEGSGGIQIVFNVSREHILSGRSSMGLLVESDLSLQDVSVSTVINTANEDRFVITQQFKNGADSNSSKRIDLLLNGKGNKALMDDGTYKEIGSSDVDISSYILDGIDFKKSTTKEGFDKIKSCVINKQRMYLYFYNTYGTDEIGGYSYIVAGILYGSLSLYVCDFGSLKMVNVVIDPSSYDITVNT